MKIPLSKGKFALVDDDAPESITKHKWCFNGRYAVRFITNKENGKRKVIKMHREIMEASKGIQVDHINQNKLDNRKSNLRFATPKDNARNRGVRQTSYTGFKGVTVKKNRFVARITANGKNMFIGSYKTPEEAALAYNQKAVELFGEFAFVNQVGEFY